MMTANDLEKLLGQLHELPRLSTDALSDGGKEAVVTLLKRVVAGAEEAARSGEWEHVMEFPRYPPLFSGEPAPGYVSPGVLTAAATVLDAEMREQNSGFCRLNSGRSTASRDDTSWFLEVHWGALEVEDYEVQRDVVPVDLVFRLERETLRIESFHAEVEGNPVRLGVMGPMESSPDGQGLEQRMRVLAVLPRGGRVG